jgi:hypothetical protein
MFKHVLTGIISLLTLADICCAAWQTDAVPAELTDKKFLNEVVRYLYRWYLNEAEVEKVSAAPAVVFEIRRLNPKLDDNDKSIFAAIAIPVLDVEIKLKKSDYVISESNKTIKSRNFKIVNVAKWQQGGNHHEPFTAVTSTMQEMREYLFKTRFDSQYPDGELFKRARDAFFQEIDAGKIKQQQTAAGVTENVLYFAPISPVSNEFWIYWETNKMLLKFSSDIDIVNPLVWDSERLFVHKYDLLAQTVVSLTETNGSNRYLTRNQVGRILFNCLILGQRFAVKRQQ